MRKFFIDKQTKMRKSLSTIMAFLLLLCATTAYSQTGTVTGTVTDTNRDPLIGVNVSVKGTTNGTITNVNGQFTLQGVSAQSVLLISYIGFITQEITVGNQRTINAQLKEDTQSLEEVIVVGYGTRKAGELTGSVSTVKMEEIQRLPAVTAGEALRNVPGLSVTVPNTPGATPNVRVRGISTVNNTEPLWVIDGVPGAPINPNDIETVTILKDAAAQAIYGTRAANGVILVTTKQGKRGERANVTFNFRTGYQYNTNHYNLLNTEEYGRLIWLEQANSGVTSGNFQHALYGTGDTPSVPDYINPARGVLGQVDEDAYLWALPAQGGNLITRANKEGTDWFKAVERNAKFTDANMNVSGGSDKSIYAFNFGYVNQEGVLKYTSFDRFNLRMNIRSDINNYITLGASLSGSFSNQNGQLTSNAEDSAISWAYRIQPIIPVYDVGGNFAGSRANAGALGNARNPLGVLYNERDNNRQNIDVGSNVYANINIIEGLQFRTQAALNFNAYNRKFISYYDISHSEGQTSDYVQMWHNYTKQWSWANTLEYKKRIGLHDFTLMGSTEAIENKYYQTWARRNNYPLRDPDFMDLTTGTTDQTNDSERREWAIFSVFGRLNYSYDSKYLFEAVVRRDGSSRFSAGNRYGVFPAFSAGWVISRESFMAPTRSWLENLKLRGGYGIVGNDRMDNDYNSYTTYAYAYNASQGTYYPMSGSNSSTRIGYRQSRLGNTDVKWESTRTTNFGLDAALAMGLSVSFDIYQRVTTDMLYPKSIPQTMGTVTAPSLNVGEMKNTGFELDLGYRGSALNRELRYNVSLNISHYKNEIIRLSGNDKEFIEGSDLRQSRYTRTEKGHAFPEFYGYIVDGIFQTDAEVASHATFGSFNKVGRYKFKDISGADGKPDGKIDAYDRTYIGSPHPDFTGGMNFSVEYKGFDLNGQFRFSYGNEMVNYARRWMDYEQFKGGRSWESLYKTWGSPYLVGTATLPMAEPGRSENQMASTVFIEDASFLRLTNLQIGYDLGKLLNTPVIPSLRLYFQVSNLFTFTKYTGLDPETSQSTGRTYWINYGTDQGQVPTPRQLMLGITLGL